MHDGQMEMLKRLQALEFSGLDFVLYLDTHPNDARALADYKAVQCETKQLAKVYAAKFGPLYSDEPGNDPCWRWVDEPWPWEIDYC